MSADVIAEIVAKWARYGMTGIRRDWWPGRGSGLSALAQNISWSSSTGSWPRWCTSAMGPPTTCWPAGSVWTAPPSPGPSAKSGLLAERGCTISQDLRPRTLAEVIDHLGSSEQTGIIDGTEIRVRRPAVGRKDREKFISGKNKQNAVKAMVLTDEEGRMLFCSPAEPASCADITHARQLGLVKHLVDGPAVEILADAGYQGLGAQTGGRVVTPPHRNSRKKSDPGDALVLANVLRTDMHAHRPLPQDSDLARAVASSPALSRTRPGTASRSPTSSAPCCRVRSGLRWGWPRTRRSG